MNAPQELWNVRREAIWGGGQLSAAWCDRHARCTEMNGVESAHRCRGAGVITAGGAAEARARESRDARSAHAPSLERRVRRFQIQGAVSCRVR